MTLVEKAKALEGAANAVKSSDQFIENLEMAMAIVTGKISLKVAASVLECRPNSAHQWADTVIRKAIRAGLVGRIDKAVTN